MADEFAFEKLTSALEARSHYISYIEDAEKFVETNNSAIEDFNELIKLKQQSKTSITSRYSEKIAEILCNIPSDIKVTLSNDSLGNASRANLTLDFLGKRFFLLNKGIFLSPSDKNEEQTIETFARYMASSMAKNVENVLFCYGMLDILELHNEYNRNPSTVPEILIDREMEKQTKALSLETTYLTNQVKLCKSEIQGLTAELEAMKKAGIIEKLLNLKYIREGKQRLEFLKGNQKELEVKLSKAMKDEEEFNLHIAKEREKVAKRVKTALSALDKFVAISAKLGELKSEYVKTYNAPIADLEERKAAFVKNNEALNNKIQNWNELIAQNEKEAKEALKDIYENEKLTKKLLATSIDWGTDERTARAIEYVKANYKKELSSKITTLLN